REGRFMEPAYADLPALVGALVLAIAPLLDVPFAFFGHSMGAFIAFELARELRRTSRPLPVHLFVAAARAPHLPDRDTPYRSLADEEFVARLKRLNGFPTAVLETPELLDIILPTLRSDITLCERYAHQSEKPLDCPITAFGGRSDGKVRVGELAAWRALTRG